MRYYLLVFLTLVLFSCGKDKVVQLPEISHADISIITDVSAAYLFYDETLPDSLELNRKNLISTTNWLVNIDKRLTLKQVIPQIIFLQEKKRSSSHKNNIAKNYFTCNDLIKKNLGFIEFTNAVYHQEPFLDFVSVNSNLDFSKKMKIDFNSSKEIYAEFPLFDISATVLNESNFIKYIKSTSDNQTEGFGIILSFNENLTFQEYITFKSMLGTLGLKNVSISYHEFIFN